MGSGSDLVCGWRFAEPWSGGWHGTSLRAQASMLMGWFSSHKKTHKLNSSPGLTYAATPRPSCHALPRTTPSHDLQVLSLSLAPLAKLLPTWLILSRITGVCASTTTQCLPNVACPWVTTWLCTRSFPQEVLSPSEDLEGGRQVGEMPQAPEGKHWPKQEFNVTLPSEIFVVAYTVLMFVFPS